MATNFTQLKYDWSQNICLTFYSSFLFAPFIFLLLCSFINFRHAVKKLFDFLFSNWFLHVSFTFILLFSQMLVFIVQEWKFCRLYLFLFRLPKSIINSFIKFSRLPLSILLSGKKYFNFLFCYQFYTSSQVLFVAIFQYFGPNHLFNSKEMIFCNLIFCRSVVTP